MLHRLPLVLVALVPLLLGRCAVSEAPEPATEPAATEAAEPEPPYAFADPDAVFELPGRLQEVSGLTYLGGATLGAVQDEDGDLFVLDAATGEVLRHHDFGPGGDYEGVERAGDRVFVLRSDGRLYETADWEAEASEAAWRQLPLHVSCDAEGLAHDPDTNLLLIACKEGAGRGYGGHRAVYAFDLAAETFRRRPAFLVPLSAVERRLGDDALSQRLRELARPVAEVSPFRPSALAVHPRTGHVWMLSATGRALVVLDRDGALLAAWALPRRLFPQPEGLTFLPDGTLFIASEGRGAAPTLVRYAYQPAP